MAKVPTVSMLTFLKRFLFFLLDWIWSKDDTLVFFLGKSSQVLSASTWIPFLEAKKNPKYTVHYSLNKKNVDLGIVDYRSLSTFFKLLRARYVFLSHGPGDVPYAWWSGRKVVTYIGHGVPLKSFMHTDNHLSLKEKIVLFLELPFYKYIIASSHSDQENLQKCFRKNDKQVIVSGLPKNDILFNKTHKLKDQYPGKKIILYAPTFRGWGHAVLFPFIDKDIEKLNVFLEENNYILLVRRHRNDPKQGIVNISSIKEFGPDVEPEIQFVLNEIDILLTDYSSLIIDFLLLDRPIGLIPYDRNEYLSRRGFHYDYDQVSPGPHILNQADLISFLNMPETDFAVTERKRIKSIFHAFDDGINSKRMLELILERD